MTIIVRHRRTSQEYILLGINGEVASANPSRFINELFNQDKSAVSCSATVCDVQGNIFLADIDDLIVTEIEGKKPAEILPEPSYESLDNSSYQEQTYDDFEDDEELAVNSNEATSENSTTSEKSFMENLGTPLQNDIDDDDDD